MKVYVARQPIVTRNQEVFAYELFYRNGTKNSFPAIDGDVATFHLLISSYLDIGLEDLSNGKPCFINFTEASLDLDIHTFFGPNELIIELLEAIRPCKKVINKCYQLKEKGYRIALDDFSLKGDSECKGELLLVADYVKVDFLSTTKEDRREIEKIALQRNISLIGEKIETEEHFAEAIAYGYTYFQGYFFEKPTIICSQTLPLFFYLQNLPINDLSLDELVEIIEGDLPLFIKLMKAAYPKLRAKNVKMTSIHQFVKELGLIEIKNFLFMIAAQENCLPKKKYADELIELSLTRAKMCQAIAILLNETLNEAAYYTLGLLSLIDKIVDIPIDNMFYCPFHDNIKEALVGKPNKLHNVLSLVLALETADWQTIANKCKELDINEKDVFKLYAESITWSKEQISYRNNLLLDEHL